MSALLKKLTMANNRRVASTIHQSFQTQCNYANNYYGDQICVEVKTPKPRINLHVGVQL